MLKNLNRYIRKHLANIPGWRTNRKIVVLESDDWGSIRMPSKDVFQKLLSRGIRVDKSLYNSFDILENRCDLIALFEVLQKYTDENGNHPLFTFNTVIGNPSFDMIKKDNFHKYHFEHFFDTYRRHYGEDYSDLWFQASKDNLIRPQFHAREHLNVELWMKALREGDKLTRFAFDCGFFGLKGKTPSTRQDNYLAAYWAENAQEFQLITEILKDGLSIFNQTFGFSPESFVACNYIYPAELEKTMAELGIRYIQTQRGRLAPEIESGGNRIQRHYTGQQNRYNQYYLVRNCWLESATDWNKNWVDSCLKDIQTAFKWKKPAIISTHRINYVGGMSDENRERGLANLDNLLCSILNRWPQTEFMSSDQLGNLVESTS